MQKIDTSILNNLSEEERKAAIAILEQYAEEGESALFESLVRADWKETPVDIETFLTNDNYLGHAWKDAGGNLKIYPFWMEQLKKLFPDSFSTAYSTFLETGARGIGKSEIACGAVGAYLMYRIMCMQNPLEFYRLKPTEKICFAFMNIKLALAEEIAVSKFQKTIQMSPWFMSRGSMTQRNNQPYWVPPEPISIIIGSQSDDVIGKPIYFAFFDEISFIKNQDIDKQKKKAQDMIDTAIGGMLTRFVYNGKNPTVLDIASSKRSEQSFLEEYIRTLSQTEGHSTLVVDKPIWEVKPKGTYSEETFLVGLGSRFLPNIVIPDEDYNNLTKYQEQGYRLIKVPIDFKAKFIEDIDRGLCDFAGISTNSMNKYIAAEAVLAIIDPKIKNPFVKDVLEIGNAPDDKLQYQNFFDLSLVPQDLMQKPLFIHLDMSVSGDMTGIAGTWIIGKKPSTVEGEEGKDLLFRLAFSVSIAAPKGRQISFEKNRQFIRWLKSVGFNIRMITSDTFQSYDLRQILSNEGFNTEILSVDRVDSDRICKPYQFLKSAVFEKRLQIYKSDRLFDEFIDVERNTNTGKVDHTPNGHKDVLDAVAGSVFTASKHAVEFGYLFGESLESSLDANESVLDGLDYKQNLLTAFEQELTNLNFRSLDTKIDSGMSYQEDLDDFDGIFIL